MKNVRTKVTAIAMMAMFIGAVIAAVCSVGIFGGAPATILWAGDGAPPVTNLTYSSKVSGTNGWNVSNVVFNLTASDQPYAGPKVGVNTTEYRIDTLNGATGVWTVGSWVNYTGKKNVTLNSTVYNGTIKLNYRSWDKDGNNESTTTAPFVNKSVIFKFDQNKPTATNNAPTAWQTAAFNITLKASDAISGDSKVKNQSGLALTGSTYAIGAAAATAITYVNQTDMAAGTLINVTTAVQGTVLINYTIKDNASNALTGNISVKIDSVAPTTTAADANVTVGFFNFTATDATSGVDTVKVSIDGAAATTVTGVSGAYSVALTAGTHTVNVTVTDVAGNQKVVSAEVTVTLPTTGGGDDMTMYIIIIVVVVVIVVVVAVLMMRKGKGKAAEAPAAEEKS